MYRWLMLFEQMIEGLVAPYYPQPYRLLDVALQVILVGVVSEFVI